MTLFQIHCTQENNLLTYDVSIPWLDKLVQKVFSKKTSAKKPGLNERLVLVGVRDSSSSWDGSPLDKQAFPLGAPVAAVKELRALTGYGLKEAKEIVDKVKAGCSWYPGEDIPDVSKCQYLKFERK